MKTAPRNLGNVRMYRSSMQQLEYHSNNNLTNLHRSSSQLSLPGNGNRANSSMPRMKKYSSQSSLRNSFELSSSNANQQRPIIDYRQRRLPQLSASYNSLSLANLHQLIDGKNSQHNGNADSDGNASADENVNRIKARGFPWNVKRADVIDFFEGIHILNAEEGIRIEKNVAMEAFVDLATPKDHDNALTRNGRMFQSKRIFGNFYPFQIQLL